MVQSIKQLEQLDLQERISSLYSYIHKGQHKNLEKKIEQLADKTINKEYSVAFCGHFSAGKSTMINHLIGENILPSSPIPTSANLVKVKTGEEYAKVYFKHEKPRMYLPPYDYEQVKNYCKDGDQIEWVEISHSDSILPKGIAILDTPGIDSTDDAHRVATESALHLADLIFYVMDYNHVQSEVNFLFTKDLTIAGKEIYLVINQIDKHREEELTFESFQQSVKESFASWGVEPKRIFYTSLKELNHPLNQFEELQSFISERILHLENHLNESLFTSLNQLGNEHLKWVEETKNVQYSKWMEVLNEVSNEELNKFINEGHELQKQISNLESLVQHLEKNFYDETEKILKSAYLMPFQTRELAEEYIKANQAGFKVGLLFSKQKTEATRQERLQQFYQDLQEKVSTQLDWHIRSFFQQVIKEYNIQEHSIIQMIQEYQTPIAEDLLNNNLKQGALFSGEYLLNYTNEVVNEIQRIARRKINALTESLLTEIGRKQAEDIKRINQELGRIQPFIEAKQKLNELDSILSNEKINVEKILAGKEKDLHLQVKLFTPKEEDVVIVKDSLNNTFNVSKDLMQEDEKPEITEQSLPVTNKLELVNRLKSTGTTLLNVQGFQETANELFEKASRIENQGFTVALFGAFSAGKSSFANALMGDDILPVSPNPTTAAINKILPVSEEYPHGTVRVKLKNKEQLLVEVGRSLKQFDHSANSLEAAIINIQKIVAEATTFIGNEKIHFSFLNAFLNGFNHLSQSFGEIIQTGIDEFRDFVANETKSCFVEWIELYYDCEFTRKGITLVDTPGADSINARHTGVAFDYIKNSDAIIFVTYYNHAFSKADREFLIQLGRVKDTFELDKMFFIINAVDLANNDEELQAVKTYVKDQLITYGIRRPNLFALSSLLALKEKLGHDKSQSSKMQKFEESFYQFISDDLLQTSLASAELDLNRIINEITILIEAANADESVKAEKRNQLLVEKIAANEIISKQSEQYFETKISNELHELLFYIKQRVFLRFNDFFKESFNPAILKDDGRNLKKALNSALDELLLSIGYDFSQELRATSLRMDAFLRKSLTEFHQTLSQLLKEINKDITMSFFEFQQNQELEFPNAFDDLSRDLFQKALSTFKNPKAFFEKNEKKIMMDELETILQNPAENYLKVQGQKLSELYVEIVHGLFSKQKAHAVDEVNAFYHRFISSLENKEQLNALEEALKRIK